MNTKLLMDLMARGAMTRGVITASINDTCKHIAKLLSKKDISGVCIIGDDGKTDSIEIPCYSQFWFYNRKEN